MSITSRYNQGRSEKFSPIYVTPKDSCGARRCTVSGSLGQRPPQTPPPMTPSAMYSSPYLLKQFSESPSPTMRPRTAQAAATSNAWHAPLDNEANKQLYERHRAAGHGWRASTALGTTNMAAARCAASTLGAASTTVDYLNVEAEQAKQTEDAQASAPPCAEHQLHHGQPDETSHAQASSQNASPRQSRLAKWDELLSPAAPQDVSETHAHEDNDEQVTPPPTGLASSQQRDALAIEDYTCCKPATTTAAVAVRRSLQMRDAANFYERNSALPPSPARSVAHVPPPRPSSARAARLEAQRSDIFGHSVDRGHWTVGPVLAGRGAKPTSQTNPVPLQ